MAKFIVTCEHEAAECAELERKLSELGPAEEFRAMSSTVRARTGITGAGSPWTAKARRQYLHHCPQSSDLMRACCRSNR